MRMMLFAALLISSAAMGQTKFKPKGTCTISTDANYGVLDLEITGCRVIGDVTVKHGKMFGNFSVDVRKLDAGDLPLRTTHMKEPRFLNVKKYPKVKLYLNPVKMSGKQKFNGRLTVKNRTNPIKGTITFKDKSAVANFKINTTKYGMPRMQYPVDSPVVVLKETLDVEVRIKF